MKYLAASAFLAGVFTISVFAARPTTISGEIQGGAAESNLTIELVATGTGMTTYTGFVSPTGNFTIQDVQQGVYELRVVGANGQVLKREIVSAGEGVNHQSIAIANATSRSAASSSGRTVSVRQLAHRVPKEASKLAKKSDEFHRKGDNQGAIQLLLDAVNIDPEFVEAYNNLGCRYMLTGEFEKATEAYQKAVSIEPSQSFIYVNLAIALIHAKRAGDAVEAARHALDLDASSMKAKYALGMSLYNNSVLTSETVRLLHETAKDNPIAGLSLAQIYGRLGWTQLARENLALYADKAPPERRTEIQRWMTALKAQR